MSEFKKNSAGGYQATYLDGHICFIEKCGAKWHLTVYKNFVKIETGLIGIYKSKKDAVSSANFWASNTKTTVINIRSGKSAEISINTPWCCNPSSESYHSI